MAWSSWFKRGDFPSLGILFIFPDYHQIFIFPDYHQILIEQESGITALLNKKSIFQSLKILFQR